MLLAMLVCAGLTAGMGTLAEDRAHATVARKAKFDESKVSRDESGRFIAQAGHRENRDASEYQPKNLFDPYTTQKSDFKPAGLPEPKRPTRTTQSGSMFIQVGNQKRRHAY